MKTRKITFSFLLAMVLNSLILGIAFSQHVPEGSMAGVVERSFGGKELKVKEIDRAFIVAMMESTLGDLESRQAALNMIESPENVKIEVRDFDLRNNTLVKTAYLKKLLEGYINKMLSFKELQEACEVINNAYRKRGYFLTRAYLQAQEIKDGVVVIEIVEAKLGVIKVEGGKYYREKFIKQYFEPLYRGLVNQNRLLKTLLVLNDYPDLKVSALLEKGSEPYTVDITLKVEDKFPFHFSQTYNNTGSRYVSRSRVGSTMEYSGLFCGGDKVHVRHVMGVPERNLHFALAEYSWPLDTYGTRAGFSYTWCDFDIQREFRVLDAGGKTKIYGLYLSHPLTRTTVTTIDLVFGFDYKDIKNYLLKTISSDDQLRVLKAGISGNYIDGFKGRNFFSFFGYNGIEGILGGLKHDDSRASRFGAGGEFGKVELQLARVQKCFLGSYIIIRGTSQVASDVLPIPEQIAIGGADTVRGYPQSEYLGDHGYTASAELRIPPYFLPDIKLRHLNRSLHKLVQLLGFIDYGKVMRKNALVGERKDNEISGAGAGACFSFNDNVDFRLEAGWPVGDKESSDGANSQVYMYGIVWF